MPGNYVEILVKSQDRAKPDLDALKAKLDELSHTTADARAEVDDADAAAKLDDLRGKLLRLSGQVASPKVSLSGAVRAEAQIHAIEASLDKLGSDSGGTGKLGRLDQKMKETGRDSEETKGRVGALGQAFNLFATGGLSGGVGEMGMFQKAMMGLNLATGLGEPLIAGLTVGVGGLASGLAAAGAGAGIFGAVTKSVFSGINANITAMAAAQAKIADGATGKKLIADNKAVEKSLKGLSAPQQALTIGAANAETAWGNFTRSATSGVAGVLVPALRLVPQVLSMMKPFLAPVESALRGIVSEVSTGLNSSGFRSFMGEMAKNSGPMITGIATAIGHVVEGIGGILKAFMPMSHSVMGGLDKITGEFAKWGTTLTGHSGFQSLMKMFRSETPLAVNALKSLGGIIKTVISQMTGMSVFSNSKMLLQLAGPILKLVNALLKAHPELVWLILYLKLAVDGGKKLKVAFAGIQDGLGFLKTAKSGFTDLKAGLTDSEAAAQDGASAWTALGGKIGTAITAIKGWGIWSKIASAATKVWTGVQAAFDAVMDANPIVLIVIAIGLLVAAIVICTVKFKSFRDFWKDAWKDIKQWASDAWHFLEGVFKDIAKEVKTAWDDVKKATSDVWGWLKSFVDREVSGVKNILNWFGRLGSLFRGWWDDAVRAVESAAGRMISFVRELPGKILGALESLPGKLFSLGKHIIEMLAQGLRSAVGDVTGAIGHIAGEITSHLPFSPAKKGPLSGAGDPTRSGRKISQMLAQGMTAGKSAVSSAAATVAGAAAIGAGGYGAAGSGGGGRLELTVRAEGADSQLMTVLLKSLRLEVRRTGGGGPNSVQRALGRVT